MHQAQIDVQSRLMMFEFAEFGSLSGILKKWCEPVITADDPREAKLLPPFLPSGPFSTLDRSNLKIISTTIDRVFFIFCLW